MVQFSGVTPKGLIPYSVVIDSDPYTVDIPFKNNGPSNVFYVLEDITQVVSNGETETLMLSIDSDQLINEEKFSAKFPLKLKSLHGISYIQTFKLKIIPKKTTDKWTIQIHDYESSIEY